MIGNIRRATLLTVVSGALAVATGASAQTASSPQAQSQVKMRSDDELRERQQDVLAQATEALATTREALTALQNDDKQGALKHLANATGKLDIVLARRPELALAPVEASVVTIRMASDLETLHAAKRAAVMALVDNQTQLARSLLQNFADQTAVRVENLPMATYPTAIKRAAALIEADKMEEAKASLQQTLSTVVITETVYPYPVINAVVSLAAAEELAAKSRKTDDERTSLAVLLEAARNSLQRANVFGYISSETARSFENQVRAIELATIAGGKAEREFAKLLREVRDASSNKTRSQ